MAKLQIVWDKGAGAKEGSAPIAQRLSDGLNAPKAFADHNEGNALQAIAGAAKRVSRTAAPASSTSTPTRCSS